MVKKVVLSVFAFLALSGSPTFGAVDKPGYQRFGWVKDGTPVVTNAEVAVSGTVARIDRDIANATTYIEADIAALGRTVAANKAATDARVEAVAGRVAAVEGCATGLEGRADALEYRMTNAELRITAATNGLSKALRDDFDTLIAASTNNVSTNVIAEVKRRDDAVKSELLDAIEDATNGVLEAVGQLQDEISDHVSDTGNPHGVTAEQIGARRFDDLQVFDPDDLHRGGVEHWDYGSIRLDWDAEGYAWHDDSYDYVIQHIEGEQFDFQMRDAPRQFSGYDLYLDGKRLKATALDSFARKSKTVPVTRKVNGHALSQDVTLTPEDIGARGLSDMNVYEEVPSLSASPALKAAKTYRKVGKIASESAESLSAMVAAAASQTNESGRVEGAIGTAMYALVESNVTEIVKEEVKNSTNSIMDEVHQLGQDLSEGIDSVEQTAGEAHDSAERAQELALEAKEHATNAWEYAQLALSHANNAQDSADDAQASAAEALEYARNAGASAESAQDSADEAYSKVYGLESRVVAVEDGKLDMTDPNDSGHRFEWRWSNYSGGYNSGDGDVLRLWSNADEAGSYSSKYFIDFYSDRNASDIFLGYSYGGYDYVNSRLSDVYMVSYYESSVEGLSSDLYSHLYNDSDPHGISESIGYAIETAVNPENDNFQSSVDAVLDDYINADDERFFEEVGRASPVGADNERFRTAVTAVGLNLSNGTAEEINQIVSRGSFYSNVWTTVDNYFQSNDVVKVVKFDRQGAKGDFGTGWGYMVYNWTSDERFWKLNVPQVSVSSSYTDVGSQDTEHLFAVTDAGGTSRNVRVAPFLTNPLLSDVHIPGEITARLVRTDGKHGDDGCASVDYDIGFVKMEGGTASEDSRFLEISAKGISYGSGDFTVLPSVVGGYGQTFTVEKTGACSLGGLDGSVANWTAQYRLSDFATTVENVSTGKKRVKLTYLCSVTVAFTSTSIRGGGQTVTYTSTPEVSVTIDHSGTTGMVAVMVPRARVADTISSHYFYDEGLKVTWEVAVSNGCFFGNIVSTKNLTITEK